jgi:hypothetical protein
LAAGTDVVLGDAADDLGAPAGEHGEDDDSNRDHAPAARVNEAGRVFVAWHSDERVG